MFIKGFLKRFAPFFIALALGLFVASFFVSVAFPKLRFNRGWRSHREYHRKLEFENQRLREENQRLAEENFRSKRKAFKREAMERQGQQNLNAIENINELVPPPPPLPVRPPAPVRK